MKYMVSGILAMIYFSLIFGKIKEMLKACTWWLKT